MYYTESEEIRIGRVRHRWAATYVLSTFWREVLEKSEASLLYAIVVQLVEHQISTLGVAGSSPVYRSILRISVVVTQRTLTPLS